MADEDGRILLEPRLRALLSGLVAANPSVLGHVDPGRIVLVAGAARRKTRASIRPLTFGGHPPVFERNGVSKPKVQLDGRLALYELCLRPLFFLRTPPEERLRILAHELWHISPGFDGTLDPRRRHPLPDLRDAEASAAEMAIAARKAGVDTSALQVEGELRAPMWLERPPSLVPPGRSTRLQYSQQDLFLGVVIQRAR